MRRHKNTFLRNFAQFGNVTAAAAEAGISRGDVYRWKKQDARFLAAFIEAENEAVDVLEHAAWKRAVDGVESTRNIYNGRGHIVAEETETKYSDTLLIFLLKSRDPKKYAQRQLIGVYDATKEAERVAAELGLPVEQVMREAGLLMEANDSGAD